MCIGIPMRVIESDGFTALCEVRGEQRRVNVMLIEGAEPGAWVLTHMGNAVRLLEEEEASQINEALEALNAALNGESVDGYFADLRRH
jgi:hydrogenase expression/formation protein HypC